MDDMNAFDRQLASVVHRRVGPSRPVDDSAIFTAITTTQSPKWRFQTMFSATKFVVAGAIVALFGGFLLAGVLTQRPSEESVPAVGASASPSPSPDTSYLVSRVPTGGMSTRSISTEEALWIPGSEGVSRMDSVTNEVTRIPASEGTRWLVASDDAIWAIDGEYVERIDRTDLTVGEPITRDRGQPFMWQDDCHPPIIADGSLWIAAPGSESHSLVEIDLATRSIRDEYVAEDDWSVDGCGPWMGVIGDAIWVHSTDPDGSGYRLTRFDLGTREFSDTIDDLPGTENWFGCCIVDDEAIWLMDERAVSRFDTVTLEVTDTVDVGRDLNGGIAAAGALWVVGRDGQSSDGGKSVYRLDARTREVTDTIALGHGAEPPAFLHGAIWVASHQRRQGSVSRIDVGLREVTDTMTLPLGHAHTPLASDGVIWVYTQEGNLMRIDPGATSE